MDSDNRNSDKMAAVAQVDVAVITLSVALMTSCRRVSFDDFPQPQSEARQTSPAVPRLDTSMRLLEIDQVTFSTGPTTSAMERRLNMLFRLDAIEIVEFTTVNDR